ncbi:hypothetical protein FGO68_gene6953 [Halteria grandinella]|uniref:Transmembrane protein n=1 Tax=Halteria grandinella TaxID=5974 RepID=A0A8J8NZT2_HALGN|nr:hypothetical protein FGO68_gene6953 [Halteria grandinella]
MVLNVTAAANFLQDRLRILGAIESQIFEAQIEEISNFITFNSSFNGSIISSSFSLDQNLILLATDKCENCTIEKQSVFNSSSAVSDLSGAYCDESYCYISSPQSFTLNQTSLEDVSTTLVLNITTDPSPFSASPLIIGLSPQNNTLMQHLQSNVYSLKIVNSSLSLQFSNKSNNNTIQAQLSQSTTKGLQIECQNLIIDQQESSIQGVIKVHLDKSFDLALPSTLYQQFSSSNSCNTSCKCENLPLISLGFSNGIKLNITGQSFANTTTDQLCFVTEQSIDDNLHLGQGFLRKYQLDVDISLQRVIFNPLFEKKTNTSVVIKSETSKGTSGYKIPGYAIFLIILFFILIILEIIYVVYRCNRVVSLKSVKIQRVKAFHEQITMYVAFSEMSKNLHNLSMVTVENDLSMVSDSVNFTTTQMLMTGKEMGRTDPAQYTLMGHEMEDLGISYGKNALLNINNTFELHDKDESFQPIGQEDFDEDGLSSSIGKGSIKKTMKKGTPRFNKVSSKDSAEMFASQYLHSIDHEIGSLNGESFKLGRASQDTQKKSKIKIDSGAKPQRVNVSSTPNHQRTVSLPTEGILTERPMVIEENKFPENQEATGMQKSIFEEQSTKELIHQIEQTKNDMPFEIAKREIKLPGVYPLRKTYIVLGKQHQSKEKFVTVNLPQNNMPHYNAIEQVIESTDSHTIPETPKKSPPKLIIETKAHDFTPEKLKSPPKLKNQAFTHEEDPEIKNISYQESLLNESNIQSTRQDVNGSQQSMPTHLHTQPHHNSSIYMSQDSNVLQVPPQDPEVSRFAKHNKTQARPLLQQNTYHEEHQTSISLGGESLMPSESVTPKKQLVSLNTIIVTKSEHVPLAQSTKEEDLGTSFMREDEERRQGMGQSLVTTAAHSLYKPAQDDRLDKHVAKCVNFNEVQIPFVRLFSNTYLVGTELAFPYTKGDKCLINTEELEHYVKRNEEKEKSKIAKIMQQRNLTYAQLFRHLLEKNLSDDQEIEAILQANKAAIIMQSKLYV